MNQSAFRAELVKRSKKMKPPKAKFRFGKHNGRTLDWVVENDPQYIVWVHDNVARSYWPAGFKEAYTTAFYRATDDVDEDELDAWARSELYD